MKKYLGSGLVKGIGPVNAGRIVDAFGEATFEVIDADARRLTEVPGIGPVRAGRIAATWAEQRHIREVMAALQGYGISTSLAVRIYEKFGNDSGRVTSKEPYRPVREIAGLDATMERAAEDIAAATIAQVLIERYHTPALESASNWWFLWETGRLPVANVVAWARVGLRDACPDTDEERRAHLRVVSTSEDRLRMAAPTDAGEDLHGAGDSLPDDRTPRTSDIVCVDALPEATGGP